MSFARIEDFWINIDNIRYMYAREWKKKHWIVHIGFGYEDSLLIHYPVFETREECEKYLNGIVNRLPE